MLSSSGMDKILRWSKERMLMFRSWGRIAYSLDVFTPRLFFKEREVWSCQLGMNTGDEQMGVGNEFLRPVIVMRKFSSHLCWVIPLTRTIKYTSYYFIFCFKDNERSAAILTQLRLIDAQRFHHRMGSASKEDFRMIKEKLKELLP